MKELFDAIGQLFFIEPSLAENRFAMSQGSVRTIALHTLGCKLNYAETATIGRQFERSGYRVVPMEEGADVVVVNTCSVTERADRECRQIVRRALRSSPRAYVAVVGCYAQLQPEQIAAIEGVDLVAGSELKFDLLPLIGDGRKTGGVRVVRSDVRGAVEAIPASSSGADRTRAFLKIQDGCDYMCSFCTIPEARGPSRSLPEEKVLGEARQLVDEGYQEIVLTGVNTADYGSRKGRSLVQLLRSLTTIDGLERLRISSVEPNLLSDELLAFWLSEPKLCKHWHIPLQSGSNSVLARMRRRYRAEWYVDRVWRIAAAIPEAGIGADVIVGFPGETDEEFAETEELLKEIPVSYLHVFSYSERSGTPALSMPHPVPVHRRADRSERLRSLSERKRRVFHERFVGRNVEVLVEGRTDRGWNTGLTEQYARVEWEAMGDHPKGRIPIRILSADHESCIGTPLLAHRAQERDASDAA